MDLNPQQSYKSVSEMHDRLTTYRQLEAEVANLRAQLSATQAREAMLVEAHNNLRDAILNGRGSVAEELNSDQTNSVLGEIDDAFSVALSNSTEHTEKFLAEVRAKALEDAALQLESYDWPVGHKAAAETVRRMANELRGE